MRVLSISSSDWKGGAAKVAFYLTEGLRARGVDADLYVRSKTTDAPFVHELPIRDVSPRSLRRRVLGRLGLGHLYQKPRLEAGFAGPQGIGSYDVVHFHDVPTFFPEWFADHVQKPLVWTIHSMQPLTGACLYAYGCERWTQTCGECPQFGTWPLIYTPQDRSAEDLAYKRALYQRMGFHAVGVSNWITEQVGRSVIGHHPSHTVQNPSWRPHYFPVDRAEARRKLGVPEGAFAVMLSVSGKVEDTRKGIDIVCAATKHIRETWGDAERLFLLPTGIVAPSDELSTMLASLPGLAPRHLETVEELRSYYAAADVVWHPSRADTSSMVSLEAFGCGTPVIAAAVGGVPEVVEDDVSGLLIPPEDPQALAAATRRLMDDPTLAVRLREGALQKSAAHAPERFVDEYLDIYRQAISGRQHARTALTVEVLA